MDELSGWRSEEAAEKYKNVIDFIVPGRADILDIIAGIAAASEKEVLNILDIGSGQGDVTAQILKLCPDSLFTLIDYSESMVSSARERFSGNPNIIILQHDLNEGLPEILKSSRFDAVVSCFAVHHIEYENRVKLYRDIYKVLDSDSCFINGDIFKGDSPKMNDWEFDNWISYMAAGMKKHLGRDISFEEMKKMQLDSFERMGDKPGTIWDMYADLKTAGFKYADCMYKLQNLAVIVGAK